MPTCARRGGGCEDCSLVGLQQYCECKDDHDNYRLFHKECIENERIPPYLDEEAILSCMDETGDHILAAHSMLWRCSHCEYQYVIRSRQSPFGACSGRMSVWTFWLSLVMTMVFLMLVAAGVTRPPPPDAANKLGIAVLVTGAVVPLLAVFLSSSPYGCVPKRWRRRNYLEITRHMLLMTVRCNVAEPIISPT